MAENESLDLKSPQARRWFAVLDKVRKGGSCHDVAMTAKKCLFTALRRVLNQFEEYGVTTDDFLENQNSPQILNELVRRTKGHDYAELLASVLSSNPAAPRTDCLHHWVRFILDKVFEPMMERLTGSGRFPSFLDSRDYFQRVRDEISDDLEKIAINLADDPHWRPVIRRRRGDRKSDVTAELLPMSLIR